MHLLFRRWVKRQGALDILTRLAVSMRPLGYDVHDLARMTAQRYGLGFYDALIVAAAQFDQCETLYSEDMQHGLVIDGTLTIINPFLNA
jgi:predicted nucleic acid-binding protein